MKKYLLKPVKPAGNTDLFDELPLWSAPFGLKLLDHIDYRPNITALDIGFGTGFPLIELAMRLGESSIVYGIDPWDEAHLRVKRKIDNCGFYDQLEFVLSEMKMYKEIKQMHHHIYEKRRPLDEIAAMLQKHGFTIKALDQDLFHYKFTDGTAMFNHYFIRLAFMEAWIKFLPQAKLEEIFDKVETRLNDKARVSSGVKLSVPFAVIDAKRNLA